jgi:hypothetical protein
MKIQPNKKDSLNELIKMQAFPWIKSRPAYRTAVLSDKEGDDILQTEIIGNPPFRGYFILGKNITKFVKAKQKRG